MLATFKCNQKQIIHQNLVVHILFPKYVQFLSKWGYLRGFTNNRLLTFGLLKFCPKLIKIGDLYLEHHSCLPFNSILMEFLHSIQPGLLTVGVAYIWLKATNVSFQSEPAGHRQIFQGFESQGTIQWALERIHYFNIFCFFFILLCSAR